MGRASALAVGATLAFVGPQLSRLASVTVGGAGKRVACVVAAAFLLHVSAQFERLRRGVVDKLCEFVNRVAPLLCAAALLGRRWGGRRMQQRLVAFGSLANVYAAMRSLYGGDEVTAASPRRCGWGWG